MGGSTPWDEEDRNFGEQRQGRSESEISGSVGKTEKGDIIAWSMETLSLKMVTRSLLDVSWMMSDVTKEGKSTVVSGMTGRSE
jgi:hypothetical protein